MVRFMMILFVSIAVTPMMHAQIRNLQPDNVVMLDLNSEDEKRFEEDKVIYNSVSEKLSNGVKPEDLTQHERDVYDNANETIESYWDIIGGGCSWYCAGGPKQVTASSTLKPQGEVIYDAENAHDLNYKTAWVEGIKGYGIGEYLLYHFAPESPRINKIIVVNGYVKSQAAWENNSRVKKLKMYINDRSYAILNLRDERASQSFSIDPIGESDRQDFKKIKTKPDWTIKFEILEVYKGNKFDDVAISEIYFDGLDVHCFARGTKISLSGGYVRNIEDLKAGDCILTFDHDKNIFRESTIQKMENVVHEALVKYTFDNGQSVTVTQDHPFFLSDGKWASLKPENSMNYKDFENIGCIRLHDDFRIIAEDGKVSVTKLIDIEYLKGCLDTFTISKLDSGNNFIANGCIVGVEDLRWDLVTLHQKSSIGDTK